MADAPAVAPTTPAAPPPSAPPPSTPPAAPPAAPPASSSATPPASTPSTSPATPPATPPQGNANGTMGTGGAWRDDWRGAMAKGDDKLVKRLERYATPEAAAEALFSAQDSIAKHGLRMALPADATPEQVAEYRKANGVPEAPDKYDLTLPGGLVVGEADKPIVDHFTKFAHDHNWSSEQVKQNLEWYYSYADQVREKTEEADATYKETGLAKLGQDWGGNFKRNLGLVNEFLNGAPEGVADMILGARGPDGRLLGANPTFINWVFEQAHFRNPQATVMGGNSEANVRSAEKELADLRGMMGDKNSAYWKGPDAPKNQARFRELTTAVNAVKAQQR